MSENLRTQFTLQNGFIGDSINSGEAYGFQSNSSEHLHSPSLFEMELETWNLDVDGDGEVTALSDGLMVMRHLLGSTFTGDALTNGVLSPTATRTTEQVRTYIQNGLDLGFLDIDGDGNTTAWSDGLMVIRYLFKAAFAGDALTNGAISSGATRTTEQIRNTLKTLTELGPDLRIASTSSPSTIEVGDTINLSVTTKNYGDSTAGASNTKYWISDDITLDSSDRLLAAEYISPLSANSSKFDSHSFTWFSSYGTGTKYILFEVDGDDYISESNEFNNIAYHQITVNPPAKPDLQGTFFDSPESLTAGASYTVNYKVQNTDNVSAGGFYVKFYASTNDFISNGDYLLGSTYISSLGANTTTSHSQTITLPSTTNSFWGGSGNYTIGMIIDANNNVSESNEGNNVNRGLDYDKDTVYVSVATTQPDLRISSTSAPSIITVGDTVNLSVTTKNDGNVTAGASNTKYWISDNTTLDSSDRLIATEYVGSRIANSTEIDSHSFTWLSSYGTGTKYILFEADANKNVSESNELNNITYRTITVSPIKPDLVVANPSVLSSITVGDFINISADVKNIGGTFAGLNRLNYYISNDQILDSNDIAIGSSIIINGIHAGSSVNTLFGFTWNSSFGTGNKYILFKADGDDSIVESNESNNVLAQQITINQAKPDLQGILFDSPENLVAGNAYTVNYKLQNTGNIAATIFDVKFYLSHDSTIDSNDYYLGSPTFSGISANATTPTLSTTIYAPIATHSFWNGSGNYTLGMIIDYANEVSESNENNNRNRGNLLDKDTVYVSVPTTKPDLRIASASATSTLTVGERLYLNVTTQNSGNATAGASSTKYWISDDTILDSGDRQITSEYVGSLAANTSESDAHNFIWSSTYGTGTKYIFFEADSGQTISESNELNNITYRQVTINPAQPNLQGTFFDSPESLTAGNSYTINYKVHNAGNVSTGGFYVKFYASTNDFISNTDHLLGSTYISSLGINATTSRSRIITLPSATHSFWGSSGNYTIGMIIDADNDVSESDELNNRNRGELLDKDTVYVSVAAAPPTIPTTWGSFNSNNVFSLNSKADTNHTIYLDFNGHTTSGTTWNTSYGSIYTPAYSIDSNYSIFSYEEREVIWEVWRRVAEDFAPFNVNVTTQAPLTSDLIKSGSSDTRWGIRVAIGGNDDDWYTGSAGGIAFLDSFNWNSDTPTYVFQNRPDLSAKSIAEAASHEVGHTLGLEHDGHSFIPGQDEYYQGHGSGETGWASILGVGYYQNLTQWSKGEYNGATNTEDDLFIITSNNGFGYRNDDFGNSLASSSSLSLNGTTVNTTYGIIEKNTDYDYFKFYSSGGTLDLNFDVFDVGPNLHLLARLYNSSGSLLGSYSSTSSLSTSIVQTISAGNYYISVTGTGNGSITGTGYSDYGSLGQYKISGQVA